MHKNILEFRHPQNISPLFHFSTIGQLTKIFVYKRIIKKNNEGKIWIMLDELDMQDTAGEAGTSSKEMYSYGPPHMVVQKQDDQYEHTFSSYVFGMLSWRPS